MKQGKQSHMTPKRQEELDTFGFCWDTHESTWLERLRELTEFKRKHGHCLVATNYNKVGRIVIVHRCTLRIYYVCVSPKSVCSCWFNRTPGLGHGSITSVANTKSLLRANLATLQTSASSLWMTLASFGTRVTRMAMRSTMTLNPNFQRRRKNMMMMIDPLVLSTPPSAVPIDISNVEELVLRSALGSFEFSSAVFILPMWLNRVNIYVFNQLVYILD
jgi:hypothetical protein